MEGEPQGSLDGRELAGQLKALFGRELRRRLVSTGVHLESSQARAILALALFLIACLGYLYMSSRPRPTMLHQVLPPGDASTASADVSGGGGAGGQAARSVRTQFIYICGAVKRPGVYEIKEGQRLFEALKLAGGPMAKADLGALNLAERVADGQKIYVPRIGEASQAGGAGGAGGPGGSISSGGPAGGGGLGGGLGGGGAGGGPGGVINLNTATVQQFDGLPGIGPVIAQRIADYRQANGPFKSVQDLRKVEGVGPKKFAQLQGLVTAP